MFTAERYSQARWRNTDFIDEITRTLSVNYGETDFYLKIYSNLQQYGVAIVNNVLDEGECNRMASGMVSDFTYLTANRTTMGLQPIFDINNPSTWHVIDELYPIDGMIFQQWGLGQSQIIWDVRTNDKIIDVFSRIYGTRELSCSYDGVSFMLPAEITNRKKDWYSEDRWHFDQKLEAKEFECIQGWVNAIDTNKGDATLAAMLGSHTFHKCYEQLYLQRFGKTIEKKGDFVRIDEGADMLVEMGCIPYRIQCPKGSLVLWDSRTLHYGTKPIQGREKLNYRMVAYVCYTPLSLMTSAKKKRKQQLFTEKSGNGCGRTTNHWPHRPRVFPEKPSVARFGAQMPIVNPLPQAVIAPQYEFLIGK